MRLGKIVQNLYSNFSESENFYKNHSSPSTFPFTDNLKNIYHRSIPAKYPSHQLCDPLCKKAKYLLTFYVNCYKGICLGL